MRAVRLFLEQSLDLAREICEKLRYFMSDYHWANVGFFESLERCCRCLLIDADGYTPPESEGKGAIEKCGRGLKLWRVLLENHSKGHPKPEWRAACKAMRTRMSDMLTDQNGLEKRVSDTSAGIEGLGRRLGDGHEHGGPGGRRR